MYETAASDVDEKSDERCPYSRTDRGSNEESGARLTACRTGRDCVTDTRDFALWFFPMTVRIIAQTDAL